MTWKNPMKKLVKFLAGLDKMREMVYCGVPGGEVVNQSAAAFAIVLSP